MKALYLFFDVETDGLHGLAFALGYTLQDDTGKEIDFGLHVCELTNPDPWVAENVLPALPAVDCMSVTDLYVKFRNAHRRAMSQPDNWGNHCYVVSDVPYPCETSFLSASQEQVNTHGGIPMLPVYPLLDVASIIFAAGLDPVGTYKRLPSELPAHNPLNDARQSARVFFAAKNYLDDSVAVLQDIRDRYLSLEL